MGYSRRKEARENVEVIEQDNRRIAGVTLGQLCARSLVTLQVSCHQCKRRGRYNLGRLITRHGPTMLLSKLAELLSADCQNRRGNSYFRKCGVYFPAVRGSLPLPEKPVR